MSTRRGCLGLALLISHLLFTFTCRPFAFGFYHLHFVYLSGASRRRAVYCVVSSGFAASRPLVAMAVGIKQISVVSIIVSVITVIVMVITTYALHAVMYSTDRRLSCMP